MLKRKGKRDRDVVEATFLQLMIAQLMSFMAQIVAQVVDSASISRFLSAEDLAAFSFSSSITSLVMMVFGLLMTGVSIYSAAVAREKDPERKTACISTALVSAFAFGIVMTALYFGAARRLAVLSGAPDGLADKTAAYIRGYSVGIAPYLIFGAAVPFTIIEGKRGIMKLAFTAMAIVDIVLDLLNGLFLHGGLAGMGLATAVSEYAALLVVLIGYFKGSRSTAGERSFRFRASGFTPGDLKEIFSYGYPYVFKQLLVTVLIFAYNNWITARYGTSVLSSYAATYSAVSFAWCIGSAIGNATASLTGLYANENDADSLHRLIKVSVSYSVTINGIVMLIFLLLSRPIMGIFLPAREESFALASAGLALISLSMIVRSINMAVRSYYQAMKMNRYNILMSVLDTMACEVFALVVLTMTVGVYGIWLSYPVGETAALWIMTVYMSRKSGTGLSFMALFPFRESKRVLARLTAVLKSEDDVMAWSVKVYRFCLDNGADAKTAGKASLAVEEIGKNIMEHGFADGKKHAVDFLIKKTEDAWILRFRDDCRAFDPVKYLEVTDETGDRLGLKLVSGWNDEFSYANVMGVNHVVISYRG